MAATQWLVIEMATPHWLVNTEVLFLIGLVSFVRVIPRT